MNKLVIKYWTKLLIKQTGSLCLALFQRRSAKLYPEVTIFVSSLNTRNSLELTLMSLLRCTNYPNFRILVGENGSTDDSLECLQRLQSKFPIEIAVVSEPRPHKDWLNEIYQTVKTPYWCAVDSDMLFLGSDWLYDMIRVLEDNPDLYLLGAEYVKPIYNMIEPVGHTVINSGGRFSTWLFCVRTSLNTQLQSDFSWTQDHIDEKTGIPFVYDVGGKLMSDMNTKKLKFGFMPFWFLFKYYHFGGMSWNTNNGEESEYQRLKQYQVADIKRRVNASSQ